MSFHIFEVLRMGLAELTEFM